MSITGQLLQNTAAERKSLLSSLLGVRHAAMSYVCLMATAGVCILLVKLGIVATALSLDFNIGVGCIVLVSLVSSTTLCLCHVHAHWAVLNCYAIPVTEVVMYVSAFVFFMNYVDIDGYIARLTGKGSMLYFVLFSFVRAGLIEEAIKAVVVLRGYLWWSKFNGDGGIAKSRSQRVQVLIFLAFSSSFGFAMFENMQYLLAPLPHSWTRTDKASSLSSSGKSGKDSTLVESPLAVLVARLMTTTPLHICCTVLVAAIASTAVCSDRRTVAKSVAVVAGGFVLAVGFHGLYDLVILWLSNSVVRSVSVSAVLGSLHVTTFLCVNYALETADCKSFVISDDATAETPRVESTEASNAIAHYVV